MSGRRYPEPVARPITLTTRKPAVRRVRQKVAEEMAAEAKPGKPIPLEKLVAEAAVAAAKRLVAGWPGKSFAVVRGAVVHGLYAEFAEARGMLVPPLAAVLPDIDSEVLADVHTIFDQLPLTVLTAEHFGAAHETLSGYALRDGEVVPSNGRRAGGVHFTPRELTGPIVRRTLEPIFMVVPPEKTLDLRTCDPSVGAGAFLLEVVRQLGERALGAGLASDLDEAKRLAAIHCAYGVDVCKVAVFAAKLALTLECRADRMPVGWLDDNIKHGDALVGLTRDQLAAFHWKPEEPHDLLATADRVRFGKLVDDAISAGMVARKARMAQLATLARDGGP